MASSRGDIGARSEVAYRDLRADLERAQIPLAPESVSAAARGLGFAVAVPMLAIAVVSAVWRMNDLAMLAAFAAAVGPLLAREAVLSYPKLAATRRAALIARSSTDEMNIMIMSLRHEASLPKAMTLAGRRGSEFAGELRWCIWSVVTGVHTTFEEALHRLAARWSTHCEELKPAIRAVITASCEGTEAGRRRALDRANESLVTGAKRRIEEYTLALTVPSMVLFGIGILLPLMVGSFLPMLSWDLTPEDAEGFVAAEVGSGQTVLQTVVLMNLAFPAIALLVALDAVSKHPMPRPRGRRVGQERWHGLAVGTALACACTGACVAAALAWLDGPAEYVSCVLAATIPGATMLMLHGSGSHAADDRERREKVEDLLFSAGARMVDGENLESAMRGASADLGIPAISWPPRVVSSRDVADGAEESNEDRALAVVIEAASKDEAQAGVLAMDLAGYVRDIAELEAVLKRRLKPTLSMMRMTTHALAPVMLGVTHAIYVSLTSIGGGTGGLSPGTLFVILAAFLAEINAIVAYFAWGIGDRRRTGALAYSVGSCTLVAVLVMSAVVIVSA